jgi:hypothetical protein
MAKPIPAVELVVCAFLFVSYRSIGVASIGPRLGQAGDGVLGSAV